MEGPVVVAQAKKEMGKSFGGYFCAPWCSFRQGKRPNSGWFREKENEERQGVLPWLWFSLFLAKGGGSLVKEKMIKI